MFAFTSATTELDALFAAFVTSSAVASDPDESPAPVSVRTLLVHTSATMVPNEDNVRELYDQIDAGKLAKREDDAVATTLLVLALTFEASDVLAVSIAAFVLLFITEDRELLAFSIVAPTVKVLSRLTKSPAMRVPQLIDAGHVPLGPATGIE